MRISALTVAATLTLLVVSDARQDFLRAPPDGQRELAPQKCYYTCSSLVPKYCKDTYCPEACASQVDPEDQKLQDECNRACKPCCQATNPFDTILGDWVRTSCNFMDDFLDWYPQCKKSVEFTVENNGYSAPIGVDWLVCTGAEEKKDLCEIECSLLCPADDKKCYNTCKPCCRGLLQKQCYPGTKWQYEVEGVSVPQCKKLEQDYPDVYNSLCFPSDATVQAENGELIRMDELKIGDKVAVAYEGGSIGYEPIYQFGHQDSDVLGLSYVELEVKSSSAKTSKITMAETHYLPTHEDGELVTAGNIAVGTEISVLDPSTKTIVKAKVTDKNHVVGRGAFNPYAMKGDIIVNGVVASCHNDWSFAEKLVPSLAKPLLPCVYDTMLAFHRIGYKIFGAETWATINSNIDMTAPHVRKAAGSASMALFAYLQIDSDSGAVE